MGERGEGERGREGERERERETERERERDREREKRREMERDSLSLLCFTPTDTLYTIKNMYLGISNSSVAVSSLCG